jgi:hypothetical protein
MKSGGTMVFFGFLIVGLYMINSFFNFITIPVTISAVTNKWANLIGGILVIIGGFSFMRTGAQREHYRR